MYLILLIYLLSCIIHVHASTFGRNGTAAILRTNTLLNKREKVTWYNGQDLKRAACFGRNGMPEFDATENDMIAAMAMRSFEQCFKCIQVTNNKDTSKQIVVQVIDKCAACERDTHVDLTPAAFKKLSPKGGLSIGVLDIHFKPTRCPSGGIFDEIERKRNGQ